MTEIRMQRCWAMPNKWTFTIKPIAALLREEMTGGVWVDPFSGEHSPATITNDINPERPTTYHMDALDQLRTAFRQEYHEWRLKLEEDNRDDKELWYSSEVHERELRQIMGEFYEEKDARYGLTRKEK